MEGAEENQRRSRSARVVYGIAAGRTAIMEVDAIQPCCSDQAYNEERDD